MPRKRLFLACLAGLLGSVLLENRAAWDRAAQSLFYSHWQWLITQADHERLKHIWYIGPKILLGVIGGASLAVALLSLRVSRLRDKLGP